MEIELFIQETFREMWFWCKPIQSQGCRHEVTRMVEKVENDGREQVTCPLCQKAILSPLAFQCYYCKLLIHIPCLNVEFTWDPHSDKVQAVDEYLQTLLLHCGSGGGHGLIFEEKKKEEPRYYENKQAVCFACNEPVVVGPAYKCSAPHCPLLFHKSCAHLPRQTQHPLRDTNDALLMRLALSQLRPRSGERIYPRCNICSKRCINCIYYSNAAGEFVLDVTCANGPRVNNIYDCQPHTFIPIIGNFHFTCQLCGNKGQELASQCTFCQLFIHRSCRVFSRAIRISRHEHSLALTFPLRRLKDAHDSSCNICRGKVNAEYAAYCCQVCDFVAHLPCADPFWLRDETADSLLEESKALVSHNVKEMTLAEIHPHDLILNDEQLMDDKVCDVCMQLIRTPPFYYCVQCNFFLHSACARLPREKQHPLHDHTLPLFTQPPSKSGILKCDVCHRFYNGFTYRCEPCNFDCDVYCCTIPQILTHPSHQHPLFHAIRSEKHCSACDLESSFLCIDCDHSLCYNCATLPLEVKHEHDKHPLTLTYVAEDESRELYCLTCERGRNSKDWFYYCSKCNFSVHIECVRGSFPYIKVGSAYNGDYHEHSLTFVRTKVDFSPNCDACGEPFFDGLALKCIQCKFNVHFQPWEDICLRRISEDFGEKEDTS